MQAYKKEIWIPTEENIFIYEFTPGHREAEHVHDFFELVYVKSGECIHRIDNTEYVTHHGDLVFISCGQTHSYEITAETRLVNILINPAFISAELIDTESIIKLFRHSMFAEFQNIETYANQCVHFEGNELAEIDSVINLIIREFADKERGYKSVLHGGVRILFSKLLRRIQPPDTASIYKSNELFDEILDYIDKNYNQKISLKDIAARTFYNPVYFGNLLKKYCGKSFSAYLKEKRIFKAAEMLRISGKSVEEVMTAVGYSDKKLFYNHFKEIYKVTPGKYNKL